MPKHTIHAAHTFTSLANATFCPEAYSRLKFGCNAAAKQFGRELADSFYANYAEVLLANRIVVIPSPYNHVKNAATIMTEHFVNRLNELLVMANGSHVETSIIHRKVSYTSDYGFLSRAQRRGLIDNDSFYLNHDFLEGKLLVFIDDVRITGTHEEKLVEILERDNVPNDAFFLYFANYHGVQADIEGKLNFAAVADVQAYLDLSLEPDHHIIIRPIKFVLGQENPDVVRMLLAKMPARSVELMYYGCLAEGYYKLPTYQNNFKVLVDVYRQQAGN